MASPSFQELSRRERQVLDLVYRRGRATANEVLGDLDDPPSYSAVRATLRVLEDKGHLRHKQEGPRYIYLPTVSASKARKSALRHLLSTFFDGSTQSAVAALLDLKASQMSPDELDGLAELIDRAREEGR